MTTLLAFIVAIVVLVAFHEYGHYWVARRCGVKVLRFSIGFGKVLYSRKFSGSETEWVISAIPLGGYVKMLDEREGEVQPEELHLAFNRQPVLKRMAIVVAGPLANLLLAIVLYWGLFVNGVPGLKPILGNVAPDTPAAQAQLRAGQTIISINGVQTPSWQEVRWVLLDAVLQGDKAELAVLGESGATRMQDLVVTSLTAADLDGDFLSKLGLQPYRPVVKPVIGKIIDGGEAQKAGMLEGDRVISANGKPVGDWAEWVDIVRSHPDQSLHLEIERQGHVQELGLIPESVKEGSQLIGRIGAAPQIEQKEFDALMTVVRYSPGKALFESLSKTWETAAVSLKMMGKMIIGQASLKNLSGPVTIADYAGQSAQMGLGAYISFLALISISLGVLNLLPVPLLDGGHLLYYTVELIKGSPVPEALWEFGQKAGMALLLTLMALALFNDFSRLFLN